MRSLTQQQIDEHRMDEAVIGFLIGKPLMTCYQIAKGMGENEFEVRHSLIRLQNRGDVCKQYIKNLDKPDYYYERAHGGHSPGPEAA